MGTQHPHPQLMRSLAHPPPKKSLVPSPPRPPHHHTLSARRFQPVGVDGWRAYSPSCVPFLHNLPLDLLGRAQLQLSSPLPTTPPSPVSFTIRDTHGILLFSGLPPTPIGSLPRACNISCPAARDRQDERGRRRIRFCSLSCDPERGWTM